MMQKSNCWKGLAIAGIWLSLALMAFANQKLDIADISIGATIATGLIVFFG